MSASVEGEETASFLGADGVRLSGAAVGDTGGMPVVLSPGGGQTRHAWGSTALLLAEAGFRAISLDLRGHGQSEWSASGAYPVDDYAEDVRRFSASLTRPPILVGASMGGSASLLAAGEAPFARIAGLCLVDVSAELIGAGVAGILGFMRSTAAGFDEIEQAADAIAAYLPHRPRPRDTSSIGKNLRRRDDGRYYWHWDPGVIAAPLDPAAAYPRMNAAAARVDAPALLLRGALSEVVTAAAAADFMGRFKDGRFVDIPGARHMVAGDCNNLFGRSLLDFACDLRRRADNAGTHAP